MKKKCYKIFRLIDSDSAPEGHVITTLLNVLVLIA